MLLAQENVPAALQARLAGLTKPQDVMQAVYQYYGVTLGGSTGVSKPIADATVLKSLKRWSRWGYEMSSRTDESGNMVNYAERTLKTMLGFELSNPALMANGGGGNWELVGPRTTGYGHSRILGLGRIDRIAFHPTIANTFYVGSPAGGLWRTTDGGINYTCLTNHLPNLSVGGIVVDRLNPNIIYILTGDGDGGGLVNSMGYRRGSVGIWKSSNGGASWALTGPLDNGDNRGMRLVQDPSNTQILLAATRDGLWRTANGGTTWTKVRSGNIYDVAFQPNGSGRAYLARSSGGAAEFNISTNNGETWVNSSAYNISIAGAGRISLGVTPDNPSVVYLLCGAANPGANTFFGFYRSTNSGANFTRTANAPNVFGDEDGGGADQSGYDNCLAVSPTDANRLVTGGLVIYGSSNGGGSFFNLTSYLDGVSSERDDFIHPDVHSVAYNPADGKLYATTDGGVFVSTNNGANWGRRFNNLPVTQVYHFDVYDGDETYMLTGSQDNGVHKRDGATSYFYQAVQGDGFDVDYTANSSRFYAVINTKIIRFITDGLTAFDKLDFSPSFFPAMAIHESDVDIFYAGLSDFHRYVVRNLSDDDYVSTGIRSGWAIGTCPSNTNRVYCAGGNNGAFNDATNGRMYRHDDQGIDPADWVRLDNNPGFPATFDKITCIAVHPTNSARVWITVGGFRDGVKVYYSGDAGATWSNITQGLPNVPVNCIAVDANNNAYIGNDFGVFYRGSGWTGWKPMSNNLPRVPVTDLRISTSLNVIRAATFGRGIWSTPLYADCDAVVNVSGSKEGQQFFEAGTTLTTTATSNNGAGTEIFYRAGREVDMKTGFEVANNSQIIARTGPCASGIPVFNKMVVAKNAVDFNGFRTAALPRVNGQQFAFAKIKQWHLKGNILQVMPEQFLDGELKMVIVDDNGRQLLDAWNNGGQRVSADAAVSINLPAAAANTKMNLLLLHNNTLVHWQEIN